MRTEPRLMVALYARVSSQEQATEGVSIEAQVAALKAYARSQAWEVADEYIDGGYSGGTDDRPAFRRMLLDARQKSFNVIAVCKLDRFFRDLRLLLNHLHDLEQLGIKFVSTQEGLDTSTPYGRFAVQIMGVIAEFERERIGERVRDSRRYLIGGGNWPGGRTPYGYRWLAGERKWEVIPDEAQVVRSIYDLYINKKLGINSIVATLNGYGLATRGGAPWRYSLVHAILIRPGYTGQHRIGVAMPPLIDEATFRLAQERREKARSVLADPKGWALQGMCFCGRCGHVLKCQQKKRDDYRYYACRGRVQPRLYPGSRGRCDLPYIRADWLEAAVWKRVRTVIRDQKALLESINKALTELEEEKSRIGAETLSIDSKLEVIRNRKERLGMAFADGTVGEDTYRSKLAQLRKQEAALLRCRHNIDPFRLYQMEALEEHISRIKNILSQGYVVISDLGIFAMTEEQFVPLGFNAYFADSDGKMAIGRPAPTEHFMYQGSTACNSIYPCVIDWEHGSEPICIPGIRPSINVYGPDWERPAYDINRNIRGIMQLFDIKVFAYPGRIEIKGSIPTQVLKLSIGKGSDTARIIPSPSPFKERGGL